MFKPTLILFALAVGAISQSRTSAHYTLVEESLDSAGGESSSASYPGIASAAEGAETATAGLVLKSGFAAQLFAFTAIEIFATASSMLENETMHLGIQLTLDDGTLFFPAPSTVNWSVSGAGPLLIGAADGIATARPAHTDTAATAAASYAGLTTSATIGVMDADQDNFGNYAGDGINDIWQTQYFGTGNPAAAGDEDPDGDGFTNLFEYTAGLIPNDPASRFSFSLEMVPGEAIQRRVRFSPKIAGRGYVVQYHDSLTAGAGQPLQSFSESDDNGEHIVTDLNAAVPSLFYRVEIITPQHEAE